jgi:PqqD family protein of HPr-rel-A system
VASETTLRWRLPAGQRLVFEDFDDGVLLFDTLVGGTHLVNATAAEALAIVAETPGLATAEVHARLLERLAITDAVLPREAIDELLARLDDLALVTSLRA